MQLVTKREIFEVVFTLDYKVKDIISHDGQFILVRFGVVSSVGYFILIELSIDAYRFHVTSYKHLVYV